MDYGERTQYKHDPLNATTRTIDSGGSSTSLVYDPNENLTSETIDSAGSTTSFSYDHMNLVQTGGP